MSTVSSLGAALRSARKSAGLSLDDLSQQTNIRASLISQFEDNNFIGAGGSTYARGHIRNIAQILKCDAAALLDLYEAEHGGAMFHYLKSAENQLLGAHLSESHSHFF